MKKMMGVVGIVTFVVAGVQVFRKLRFERQLSRMEKEAAFDEVLKSLDNSKGQADKKDEWDGEIN